MCIIYFPFYGSFNFRIEVNSKEAQKKLRDFYASLQTN